MEAGSAGITAIDRIVQAVNIHIVANCALPRGNGGICIDKSAPLGVIVAGLEVVQLRFGVIDIATIAQGVQRGDGIATGAVLVDNPAPCVINITANVRAGGREDTGYIALRIDRVIIHHAIIKSICATRSEISFARFPIVL